MKKNYYSAIKITLLLMITFTGACFAQPTANFSISPSPACYGTPVQITDLSTGAPTAWSYTVKVPNSYYSTQNPTFTAGFPGTYTVILVASNGSGSSTPVTQTFVVYTGPSTVINPTVPASCSAGAPVTFSATNPGGAALTYSWSNGANTQIVTVNPTVSTPYTVVVTNTAGCSTTRTIMVSVGATLNIGASPQTICNGGASTLTALGSGMPGYSYTWSTGSNAANIVTNVPAVYSVTFTNASGCTATKSISIVTSNSLVLGVAANPSVLCVGKSATITGSGASTYTWSTGSQASSIVVSPTVFTSYTLNGSTPTCTGLAVMTLSVFPNPTISVSNNTIAICNGQSATITLGGATTYSLNNVASTLNVVVVTPTANTSYSITGAADGCTSTNSAVVNVTVNPAPTVSVSSSKTLACVGDKLTFTATGASTYSWSSGGGNPTTTLTATATNTTYTVTGTSNGCAANATFTQNVKVCTGVSEFLSGEHLVRVYPVPASHEVSIVSQLNMEITIIDQSGRLLHKLKLQENVPLLIRDLPPGFYYVVGMNEGLPFTKRLLISE